MKDKTIEIRPTSDILTIYEGAAPIIQVPEILNIKGTIDAPARWLKHKVIIALNGHVVVNRENLSIELNLEDKDHFGDTITGKAELHPIFKKFGVNAGSYRTAQELAQLFKMNRSFFENQSTAMSLVTELQNFKAKVAKEIEKSDDNRANKTDLTSQIVNSNLPEKFNLNIPIFKGEAKQLFEVEIYINSSDLTCTLVSPQANDMTESFRDEIIDRVLAAIIELHPTLTIIEE